MTSFNTIEYTIEGSVAWIFLDRPEVLNVYNVRMRDELFEALLAVRDDPAISVVVLAGKGNSFCAGADLTEFGSAPSQVVARDVRWKRDVWTLLLYCPKLTVAAIHGHCIGSGLEMALMCDIRLASQEAEFSMPEAKLGLIPAAGGTQTIPRSLGLGRSLEFLLTGRVIDANMASELGLITKVVSQSDLMCETHILAAKLANLDPRLVRLAKRAIIQGSDMTITQGLELETHLVSHMHSINMTDPEL